VGAGPEEAGRQSLKLLSLVDAPAWLPRSGIMSFQGGAQALGCKLDDYGVLVFQNTDG
jgi:hypothetical protein